MKKFAALIALAGWVGYVFGRTRLEDEEAEEPDIDDFLGMEDFFAPARPRGEHS